MAIMPIREATGRGQTWPPDQATREIWEGVDLLAALRESNDGLIRAYASSAGMGGTRPTYLTLPIPRAISSMFASLLFGEAPELTAEDDTDQERLDELVEENDLVSELHRAAIIASSEGEVWGKVSVAPDLSQWPIIEFVSRRWVIPKFVGRHVEEATFVTERRVGLVDYFRLLETHTSGLIESTLYRGTSDQLGAQVGLDEHPIGEGLVERVLTGFDEPLVVFIPNALDTDPTRGLSDYLGVILTFFAINETYNIGQANARLVGRKRIAVPAEYVDQYGRFPADDDLFIVNADTQLEGGVGNLMKPMEYTFESAALIEWVDHLVDMTLTMAGVAPQSVGRGDTGGTMTGTALKLKMTHSLMEAAGKGRYFDRGIRRLLRIAQILDAREFKRPWAQPDTLPSVALGDGLPRDEAEDSQILMNLASADAISVRERVARLHPDWSEDQIMEEVDRIGASTPASQPGGIATPAPDTTNLLGGTA